jgi:hypothetical protein
MGKLRLFQRGDTLVEVLLAITIVSMVLGGAFALTRQSATTTQRAQERSEAINLAQQQTELLRAGVVQGKDYSPVATGGFCINPATLDHFPNLADCRFGISDGAQRRYEVIIRGVVDGEDLYEIRVTWDRLGGGEQETASWRYRVKYEPVATAPSSPSPALPPIPPPSGGGGGGGGGDDGGGGGGGGGDEDPTGSWETTDEIPVCPLVAKSDRILQLFDPLAAKMQTYHYSRGPFPLTVPIPAGGYKVTFVSFDNHSQYDADNAQLKERAHLYLRDSGGNIVYKSPLTIDVPDNPYHEYQVTVFNSQFVSSSAADFLFGREDSYNPTSDYATRGSFWPVCVAFDPI